MTKSYFLATLVLLGLISTVSAAAVGEITHKVDAFYCSPFREDEDHIQNCALELSLHVSDPPSVESPIAEWPKIACFGEIEFKDGSLGRTTSRSHFFAFSYDYIIYRDFLPNLGMEWRDIEFRKGYKALDPKISWIRCEFIEKPNIYPAAIILR